MNYGPLEFAAYLRRKGAKKRDSAAVEAAREAAPVVRPEENRLTIISGPKELLRAARDARIEAVSVYEAVAVAAPRGLQPVRVVVRPTSRPLVLVLSSHETLSWQIVSAPGADLKAVLLSGYGESTVSGTGNAFVSQIGSFYAFKRGSVEFEHLEREVRRCTGRGVENFQSMYSGTEFEVGVG